ncbi:hypothetical protein ANTQUA_LOCUS8261 [Anthophora quadrimaculata]
MHKQHKACSLLAVSVNVGCMLKVSNVKFPSENHVFSEVRGYQQCVCKEQWKSNKCKCKTSGKLCNSKYRNSLICSNK